MNNILILITSIIVFFIAYAQCYNGEDMALFIFATCFIIIPAFVISLVGIVTGKDMFEM